ncbi:Glucose/arabinose dehydrogenase, beta-propeller fold [Devosia crocina]|uniref:Glucose/arabinose dehydrogenase, beta-propeller fold n=1 Tax=Devosia crocina TaxID=429728 RepID=A0A1I7N5G7_9HYPH|nr:PQQ-dependent sugar dehydrogenase [Devosia crocina]SFV29919.1 Glucose/arabinose dehydrogenase, beta-propeller fold [Devosia crocina]
MTLSIRSLALVSAVLMVPVASAGAQTSETSAGPVAATVLAEGLDHPWALALLPDGRFLVTERSGRLLLIERGVVAGAIEGVPAVVAQGQGGLLDLALAPDFETSGRIYLTYAEPAEAAGLQRGTGTAVMAAKLVISGKTGRLEDQQVIFRMNGYSNSTRHFGSRIATGQDGNLFVTLGDRGDMDRAQDAGDLAGGVVRIAPDGTIPADNPRPEGWHEAFWSIGHRNPQGATIRPSDGALFTVEHGPRGGDELSMPEAGDNFGWPIITYGVDYSGLPIGEGTEKEGLEQPIHYWDPSISPSGLVFYEGELLAEWRGDLLTGALSGQALVRLDMEGDSVVGEERLFEGQLGRIRDVRVGSDGAIYLVTDAGNGRLIRVAPEGQ